MKTLRLRRNDPALGDILRAALDEIGVGPGQEFTVSGRANYFPGDEQDSNHSVQGKADASKSAANKVWPRTGTQRRILIDALAAGRATREELCGRTGLPPNSLRPRLLEALDGGWIRQSPEQPYIDGKEVLELTEKATGALAGEPPPEPAPTPSAEAKPEATAEPIQLFESQTTPKPGATRGMYDEEF